jgi:orotidine-5'-phosphate decarboxylase
VVNPILVALDYSTAEEAGDLAVSVLPHVGGFKVGLELMMSVGPDVVRQISDLGLPVFADAKLHDIPNTVRGATHALGRHGARWVTVHASGGHEMILAGVEGLKSGSDGAGGVLAVTVLTSLDQTTLGATGVGRPVGLQVESLTSLAESAGAEGVICSPLEIQTVKTTAPSMLVVTPGIRPVWVGSQDQMRVATPTAAIEAGSDYLVIGRAITAADDPVEAAATIADSLNRP